MGTHLQNQICSFPVKLAICLSVNCGQPQGPCAAPCGGCVTRASSHQRGRSLVTCPLFSAFSQLNRLMGLGAKDLAASLLLTSWIRGCEEKPSLTPTGICLRSVRYLLQGRWQSQDFWEFSWLSSGIVTFPENAQPWKISVLNDSNEVLLSSGLRVVQLCLVNWGEFVSTQFDCLQR